jgi:hypothetical protein
VSALPASNISSHGDFHVTSAGKIASDLYTRKKGDWPVALLGCCAKPQTTDEIPLIHLPPFLRQTTDENQAVGALNLAIGPQMSHQNIFGFKGTAFTETPELM